MMFGINPHSASFFCFQPFLPVKEYPWPPPHIHTPFFFFPTGANSLGSPDYWLSLLVSRLLVKLHFPNCWRRTMSLYRPRIQDMHFQVAERCGAGSWKSWALASSMLKSKPQYRAGWSLGSHQEHGDNNHSLPNQGYCQDLMRMHSKIFWQWWSALQSSEINK